MSDHEPYDLNIGRFERGYPEWWVEVGFEGFGWRARPKRKRNGWIYAATLDELADLIDAQQG